MQEVEAVQRQLKEQVAQWKDKVDAQRAEEAKQQPKDGEEGREGRGGGENATEEEVEEKLKEVVSCVCVGGREI